MKFYILRRVKLFVILNLSVDNLCDYLFQTQIKNMKEYIWFKSAKETYHLRRFAVKMWDMNGSQLQIILSFNDERQFINLLDALNTFIQRKNIFNKIDSAS